MGNGATIRDGLRAGAMPRRTALRRVAGGGLAAMLLTAIGGETVTTARADDEQPEPQPAMMRECMFPFEAVVRYGPSAGLTLAGILRLVIAPDGSIDEGTLGLEDGRVVIVSGQITGKAVNLIFDLGDDQLMYGVGTSRFDLRVLCGGSLGGPFVGPQAGDGGDWATNGSSTVTDSQGRVYISVPTRHTLLRAPNALSGASLFSGTDNLPGLRNGQRQQALWNKPTQLAIHQASGQAYICDANNNVIRRVDINTNQVTTVVTVAAATAAEGVSVFAPRGVGTLPNGNLVIADGANFVVWIYSFGDGRLRIMAGTPGLTGISDGFDRAIRFTSPGETQVSADGRLVTLADKNDTRVRFLERLSDGRVKSSTLGVA